MASGGPGVGTVVFVSALTSALVAAGTVIGLQRAGLLKAEGPVGAPELVEVPPITGLPLPAAQELLEARRLTMVIESRRPDNQRPLDTIVEQKPLSGSMIAVRSQVSVIVSGGASGAAVPELVGVRLEDARLMLQHAGLVVGVITKTEQGEAGSVTASNPPPGSVLKPGAAVALTVADPTLVVPDVVGKPISEARQVLEDAGFVVGSVRERYHPRRRAYVVLEQSPNPSERVEAGSRVSLVINEGD